MSGSSNSSWSERQGNAPGPAPEAPVGRVSRISRLMALAIEMDRLVREGVVKDYAELARLAHVSRARVTQIMNLNLLAPDQTELRQQAHVSDTASLFPARTRARERDSSRTVRRKLSIAQDGTGSSTK